MDVVVFNVRYLEQGWVLINNLVKTRYCTDRGIEAKYDSSSIDSYTAAKLVSKYFQNILNYQL